MMQEQIKLVTSIRFGQADRLKMGIRDYKKDLETVNLYGIIYLAEKVLRAHHDNPYKDASEVLGELQLAIVEAHNKIQERWPKNTPRIGVDTVLKNYKFLPQESE